MTVQEIYDAYSKQHGAYMPIQKSVVEKFLKEYPIFKTCKDMKYLVNMLFDYVGSQQAYEEGSEECW